MVDVLYLPTGGSLATAPLVKFPTALESAQNQLQLLSPSFAIIKKSFWWDGKDTELCTRFLDNPSALREGEIIDLASMLSTRHTHSVVVQLLARHLRWSSRVVTPFLTLEDGKTGQFVMDDMTKTISTINNLGLNLMLFYNGKKRVLFSSSWTTVVELLARVAVLLLVVVLAVASFLLAIYANARNEEGGFVGALGRQFLKLITGVSLSPEEWSPKPDPETELLLSA
ncbi:hypothetical protein B0H19DRAFT_1254949 [Mycena capillaripes]|nr:hypothetical protein B0H19DRAFT_1254949 [Mycena capillaripes]